MNPQLAAEDGRRRGRAQGIAVATLIALLGVSACAGDAVTETAGGGAAPTPATSTEVGAPAGTGTEVPATAAQTPGGEATVAPPTQTAPAEPGDTIEPNPGPSSQETVLASLPGDTSGACVDADDQRDVRSGGIAAGAFDEAADSYVAPGGDDVVSLYWIPAHASELSGLTVRGTQVSGGAASFVHDETTVSELIGDTGEWRYYLTDISIPAPGTWRLEATSGEDSGCFTVTFGG